MRELWEGLWAELRCCSSGRCSQAERRGRRQGVLGSGYEPRTDYESTPIVACRWLARGGNADARAAGRDWAPASWSYAANCTKAAAWRDSVAVHARRQRLGLGYEPRPDYESTPI